MRLQCLFITHLLQEQYYIKNIFVFIIAYQLKNETNSAAAQELLLFRIRIIIKTNGQKQPVLPLCTGFSGQMFYG